MYNNFETQLLVSEIKGLLRGLETCAKNAWLNLAFDNVGKLTDETTEMRMFIDRIEDKINKYNNKQKQDEDKFI